MANNGYLTIFEPKEGIDPKLLEIVDEKMKFDEDIWRKYGEKDGNDRKYLSYEHSEKINDFYFTTIIPKLEKLYLRSLPYAYISKIVKLDEYGNERNFYCFDNIPTKKTYIKKASYAFPRTFYMFFRRKDIVRYIEYYSPSLEKGIEKEEYDLLEDKGDYILGQSAILYRTNIKEAMNNIKEYIDILEKQNKIILYNTDTIEIINKSVGLYGKIKLEDYSDLVKLLMELSKFHPEALIELDHSEINMIESEDFFLKEDRANDVYEVYTKINEKLIQQIKKTQGL